MKILIANCKLLPINISVKQKMFPVLADYVHQLKIQNRDSVFFERMIDAIVYELYLPGGVIQTAGADAIKYLNDLPFFKEDSDEKNVKII